MHAPPICFILICVYIQEVSDAELTERRKNWTIPTEKLKVHGLLAKYRKIVSSAHLGAVTVA